MKAGHLSNNLFSNKVTDNHINKFSRSEFLSTSNQFKNLIQKSEEKNNEEKDKYEKKDVHQEYLQDRLNTVGGSEQDDLFALLSGGANAKPLDIFQKPDELLTSEEKAFKNKTLEQLNVKIDAESINQKINNKSASIDVGLYEEKGAIKLDNKFKDNLSLEDKAKIQENLKNIDIKNSNKLEHQKIESKKVQLGLNSIDTKAKNDFSLQKNLRASSSELKSNSSRQSAAKAYEHFQPVEVNKLEVKGSSVNEVTIGRVKKQKVINSTQPSKSGNESFKNDLLNNTLDIDSQLDSSSDVQKGEFSKIMDMQGKFKTEGVEDIVKQANFLAKNGGGEMKLLLNPKGLGSIQLKVLMEENQLKVEMLADNDDAKEVIESSLGDLRKALGDSQLHVDEINVDTFERLTDMIAKEEEKASMQFAQDFLSEFRQQNNDFRQGVLEFPVVKKRRSQIVEDNTMNVSSKKNSQRRLDLVA